MDIDPPQHVREATNPFTSVPIEITVVVGRTRPIIRDLVQLGKNAVLELDRNLEDLVDLYVGGRLIARGTLEESNEQENQNLCVRISDIVDVENDLG